MCGKYAGGLKTVRKPSGKIYQYDRTYHVYRCNFHYNDRNCSLNKTFNEEHIEKHLLENMAQYVDAVIVNANATDNIANIDNELVNKQIKDLKTEMTKVKRMYRKGDIDEAEYDADMEELKEELQALEKQLEPLLERDLTIYEELLKSDWKALYNALNRENKRAFWRKYIKTIELNFDGTIKQLIFF